MAEQQHERVAKEAVRTSAELKTLFGRVGTARHPRGRVISAYRLARRALAGTLGSPIATHDILITLRASVETMLIQILGDATARGAHQARRELSIYGIPIFGAMTDEWMALNAILAELDRQIAATNALVATGDADEGLILGDANRVGILSPAPVARESGRWIAALAAQSQIATVRRSLEMAGAESDFMRQAVAAIDHLTTDCCLKVHGQTIELDGKFKLTGTPRFADEMSRPGFHWDCRTSVALVAREDANDDLSLRMRGAARVELRFRETAQANIDRLKKQLADAGQKQDIKLRKDDDKPTKRLRNEIRMWQNRLKAEVHPSHATSRRNQ